MSITIGICGGSACGKSTFTGKLAASLGTSRCAILSLDNYYIDFTDQRSGASVINYDQPESLDIDLFASHIELLKMRYSVKSPIYEFTSHKRLPQTRKIIPAEYLLVEGLFLFSIPRLLKLFNIKVFIDTSSDVRLLRRIKRDIKARRRNLDSILDQYIKQVRPMHKKYVEPNRALAQIVIDGEQSYSKQIPDVLELLKK